MPTRSTCFLSVHGYSKFDRSFRTLDNATFLTNPIKPLRPFPVLFDATIKLRRKSGYRPRSARQPSWCHLANDFTTALYAFEAFVWGWTPKLTTAKFGTKKLEKSFYSSIFRYLNCSCVDHRWGKQTDRRTEIAIAIPLFIDSAKSLQLG